MEVVGSTMVQVEHNGQEVRLPLIVTQGNGPTLLGREWLSALRLDWQAIFLLRTTSSLQEVLDEHVQVFREELGTVTGVKAKIYVDPEAQP